MNQSYADVFQAAWPGVLLKLGMTDKETIGDLVESLLGYYYNLSIDWDRTLQGPAADTCEDFISALELACFARWAAWYAAPQMVAYIRGFLYRVCFLRCVMQAPLVHVFDARCLHGGTGV